VLKNQVPPCRAIRNVVLWPERRRLCRFLFVLSLCSFLAATSVFAGHPTADETVLLSLDFTTTGPDARQWLKRHGFILKKDMENERLIRLTGTKNKGLLISVEQAAFGLAVRRDLDFHDVGTVEVQWGVARYPKGAEWQRGVHREPLMITLFFGPKVAADHFYLPDSPFFIGLFLGKDGSRASPFLGKSYRQTGRYYCFDDAGENLLTTSSIDIDVAYKKWFAADVVPPLTGIGIEVDTSGLADGSALAWLKKIVLYKRIQGGKKNVHR